MRHLKQRNWLRANAVNLIRNFSNAVFEVLVALVRRLNFFKPMEELLRFPVQSTSKMFDENSVNKEWDKKCRLEFGSAYWFGSTFGTHSL